MALTLDGIHVHFGSKHVLNQVSLNLPDGDVACLLGPSGSGKTTLLRAIMGFEQPSAGSILLNQTVLCHSSQHMPAHLRGIGMVFQEHALFTHLSVAQNIQLGLHSLSKQDKIQRTEEVLQLIHLSDKAHAYPHELSGGQQQRVALARALAPRPKLLLMDEPFSSLDAHLRIQLAHDVRCLLKNQGIGAVMVTHDQQEAFAFADWVGVMQNGQIKQWSSPYQLYHEPNSREIAQFIGHGVLLAGYVKNTRCIQTELGEFCGLVPDRFRVGSTVELLLRPDDVILDEHSAFQADLRAKTFHGADYMYTLALPSGKTIFAQVPSHHNHPIGRRLGIGLDMQHLIAFE